MSLLWMIVTTKGKRKRKKKLCVGYHTPIKHGYLARGVMEDRLKAGRRRVSLVHYGLWKGNMEFLRWWGCLCVRNIAKIWHLTTELGIGLT